MDGNPRCIGLDVHRDFAQVAIWQGGAVRQAGTFATTPEGVCEFAASLGSADEVALEATGNRWAIAALLASRAGRVVVSSPARTRAIAEAKVKTGKADAAILAQLLAADYLPSVWMPDPATSALRRAHIVRQRTRLKNQVHAILARNLVPRCPAADLFGIKGRAWLAGQDLPPDEQAAASALLRQLGFHAQELALIDADLGQVALSRPEVLRLMTIPGVDATVAWSIIAAAGDFTRFRTPGRLVSYLGLNPRCANPAATPPATAGSPRPARPAPAACWWRPPGPPRRHPARCARSASASAPAAACRPPSSPPPASSPCCAGT
jgi:transposase